MCRVCANCGQKDPEILNYRKPTLAITHPQLVDEWDYERNADLTPEQVTAGSNRKVGWKCARCHQRWEATIASRVRGNGCPYDAGKLPIPGKTDLATLRPDLAAEWDYGRNGDLKPEQVVLGSHKGVWWRCTQCGQSWKAKVYSRTCTNGTGCPYDAGKLPIPGKNDLATLRSDLTAEWDYERNGELRPEQFVIGSERKVWWKCARCGQSWQATIASRTRPNGTGCPYCAGKLPIPGKTDLASMRPDIAAQWDYAKNNGRRPEDFTVKSGVKVWWHCSNCKQSWEAAIAGRTRENGSGCPFCEGKLPIPGKTDLASLRPDLAAEWDYEANNGKRPEEFTISSGKKAWWKCSDCGRSWEARIEARTMSDGTGCPYCSGRLAIPGETDLATVRPDLLKEWLYELNGDLIPQQFTVKSDRSVWWKCRECGGKQRQRISARANGERCICVSCQNRVKKA